MKVFLLLNNLLIIYYNNHNIVKQVGLYGRELLGTSKFRVIFVLVIFLATFRFVVVFHFEVSIVVAYINHLKHVVSAK